MIIRIFSHKDCMAINTDIINTISVDCVLDQKTKFLGGVVVEFSLTSYEENNAMFSIDINSEDFKIHTTDEILYLKKCVIDYITTRIRKSCNDINIVKAVTYGLDQTLISRISREENQ